MSAVGDILVRVRRAAGLRQVELARRAGMPHSVLSAYEHGHREPGTATFLRLIRAAGYRFHVTPEPIDLERNARILSSALALADALPKGRRGDLEYPRLAERWHR